MLVTFHCPQCSAKLRINADAMGTSLNCPECDSWIEVPQMNLGPGFVIGGFLIKHKLGEGGMGEVYLAKQLSLERDVALKLLPARLTTEGSFLVRFLKEVHYQAKMDHPNIVTAYDAGEDNGIYFMAMAYVEGETLEEWLDRQGTMLERDALHIVRQVGSALKYASEEKGILHRDIKPGNVMITPGLAAKVLDMGLSKSTMEKKSTTHADTLLGTPNYMSPEQIDHPNKIDTRSDLFSLGMSCYHMLTGQVPFEDTSYLHTLKRHASEQLEDPRKLMPGISEGMSRLLARMLARSPDHRYADWNAFLKDLDAVRAGGHLPALPEGESVLALKSSPPAPPSEQEGTGPVWADEPEVRDWNVSWIVAAVFSGLLLGLAGVAVMNHRLPSPEEAVRTPASPEAGGIADPVPAPIPTVMPDRVTLQRRQLTEMILTYERNPYAHDETLAKLLALADDAAAPEIADQAAGQIVRIRREREEALQATRTQVREETLQLLYEQGVLAARGYIESYNGPFAKEIDQVRNRLLQRIAEREGQEQRQREAETAQALEAFDQLLDALAPRIVKREWILAMEEIRQAAEDPAYFAVSERIESLQEELSSLKQVPREVMETYRLQLRREVTLRLESGEMTVQILDVVPGVLVVSQTLFSDEGVPLGSVEQEILFSELSSREVIDRLQGIEGPVAELYRALLYYQLENLPACRTALDASETLLAGAVRRVLFPGLEEPQRVVPAAPSPGINTLRSAPVPTPAWTPPGLATPSRPGARRQRM
jgi:serine/threonine-protein kinase